VRAVPGSRRQIALIAAAAVAVLVGVVLLVRGGGDESRTAVAAGEPLAFVPADADVVLDVDLGVPLVAIGFEQLAGPGFERVPVRGRAALALRGEQRWVVVGATEPQALAARVRERRPRAAVGVRGGAVVLAPTPAALAEAMRGRGLGRRAFERRLARLPRRAGARVALRPRALLARFSAGLAATRWARTLRDGAAALVVDDATARVPFRLNGSPAAAAALPIAAGRAAPRARGSAPVVIGVRDPARTLRFAREAGLLPQLDVVDRLPRFLRPDLERLGPDGTLTSDGRGTLTIRTQPPDPGDWSRKLNRLDALSGLARRLGIADVRIDRRGDAYRIDEGGRFALRVGVFGDTLMLSTSPTADLQAAARAPAAQVPPGAAGALTATLAPEFLLNELGRRLSVEIPRDIVQLSPLTGWLRTEPSLTTGELRLTIAR